MSHKKPSVDNVYRLPFLASRLHSFYKLVRLPYRVHYAILTTAPVDIKTRLQEGDAPLKSKSVPIFLTRTALSFLSVQSSQQRLLHRSVDRFFLWGTLSLAH